MLGKLITMFFDFLLSAISSLVSLIFLPLDLLFSNLFPGISDSITGATNTIVGVINGMGWVVGLVPFEVRLALLTILALEISYRTVLATGAGLGRLFKLIRKIKFW